MEQVKEILGSPGESEVLDPEHNTTELWYYSEPRLQLLFQKETWWEPDPQEQKKKVLVQISTGHPETTLWGRKVMGLSLDEARAILKARFTEKVEEEADCPDGSFPFHSLRDEHVRLSLDFLDRAVTTVLFGNLQLTFPATLPRSTSPDKTAAADS
jgi:hypothetical protein